MKVPYFFVKGLADRFFKVFGDECMVFVVVRYFVTEVYPRRYFENLGVRMGEVDKFLALAKVLRPKIMNALTLKFNSNNESDLVAFEVSLGNLSLEFFSLFFDFFSENETLRIFDYLLIQGFPFLHKLLIALISTQEKQIISNIQKLKKALSQSSNRDLLIFIGNYTFHSIISSSKTQKIEVLLRKSTKKPKYSKINLNVLPLKANNYLLTRLKNAKEEFKLLSLPQFTELISQAKKILTRDQVSSLSFHNLISMLSLPQPLQLKVLSLLSQKPCIAFEFSSIASLLAVLSPFHITEKLNFLFESFSPTLSLNSSQANSIIKSLLLFTQEFNFKSEYFLTSTSIPDFINTLESDPDLVKVLQILEIEPKPKSFSGSYKKTSSDQSIEEDSQDLINEISEPNPALNLFPTLIKPIDSKSERSKCARLCGPTCIIT